MQPKSHHQFPWRRYGQVQVGPAHSNSAPAPFRLAAQPLSFLSNKQNTAEDKEQGAISTSLTLISLLLFLPSLSSSSNGYDPVLTHFTTTVELGDESAFFYFSLFIQHQTLVYPDYFVKKSSPSDSTRLNFTPLYA